MFEAELDPVTGLYTYLGKQYTPQEFLDLKVAAIEAQQDAWAEMRDPSRADQNLWGTKEDGFQDDWFHRIPPIIAPIGKYPHEIKPDDWRP